MRFYKFTFMLMVILTPSICSLAQSSQPVAQKELDAVTKAYQEDVASASFAADHPLSTTPSLTGKWTGIVEEDGNTHRTGAIDLELHQTQGQFLGSGWYRLGGTAPVTFSVEGSVFLSKIQFHRISDRTDTTSCALTFSGQVLQTKSSLGIWASTSPEHGECLNGAIRLVPEGPNDLGDSYQLEELIRVLRSRSQQSESSSNQTPAGNAAEAFHTSSSVPVSSTQTGPARFNDLSADKRNAIPRRIAVLLDRPVESLRLQPGWEVNQNGNFVPLKNNRSWVVWLICFSEACEPAPESFPFAAYYEVSTDRLYVGTALKGGMGLWCREDQRGRACNTEKTSVDTWMTKYNQRSHRLSDGFIKYGVEFAERLPYTDEVYGKCVGVKIGSQDVVFGYEDASGKISNPFARTTDRWSYAQNRCNRTLIINLQCQSNGSMEPLLVPPGGTTDNVYYDSCSAYVLAHFPFEHADLN